MSHGATNWAIQQRGLKPATKVVLWHLCDRHNKDTGRCDPSQEQLADDAEMSRATVNRHLEVLEDKGLIRRVRRFDRGTGHRERTFYRLAFDTNLAMSQNDTRETPENQGDPMSQNETRSMSQKPADPCLKNRDIHVSNCDMNPVREPGKEPGREREGAREPEIDPADTQTPQQIERAFKKIFHRWPTYLADSEAEARKVWFALTDDDRDAATDRLADYLDGVARAGRRKHCAFAVFLREKRWERLPAKVGALAPDREPAAPWGKLWNAGRLALMVTEPRATIPQPPHALAEIFKNGSDVGRRRESEFIARHSWPKVNMMLERAETRLPSSVPLALERLAERFDKCPTDGPIWQAWVDLHRQKRWPLPDHGLPQWVWMPVPSEPGDHPGPADFVAAALTEFEAALAAMSENVGDSEEASNDERAA